MPAMDLAALLRWYVETGADEAIGETPVDRFAQRAFPPTAAARPAGAAAARATGAPAPRPMAAAPLAADSAIAGSARAIAEAANTLEELEAALRRFDGCALKATATNTVFADGNPASRLMIIGEAPGGDEDRLGRPFVGRSGQLLDRMLAAIGIERATGAYIANVLYWRPPGNRKPTPGEIAACLPFVLRQVALVEPAILMLCGGTATSALLGTSEGITRLRGRWFDLSIPGRQDPVPTLATFHPSYLLRSPASKREAWRDLVNLSLKLEELKVTTS